MNCITEKCHTKYNRSINIYKILFNTSKTWSVTKYFTLCLGKLSHPSHSIPSYSKSFNFLILQTIPFHSIFFSTIFFNFSNPYTISLNLNHLYHLEIHKVKPFNIFFFQTIFKPFFPSQRIEWDGQNGLPKHMVRIQSPVDILL